MKDTQEEARHFTLQPRLKMKLHKFQKPMREFIATWRQAAKFVSRGRKVCGAFLLTCVTEEIINDIC